VQWASDPVRLWHLLVGVVWSLWREAGLTCQWWPGWERDAPPLTDCEEWRRADRV